MHLKQNIVGAICYIAIMIAVVIVVKSAIDYMIPQLQARADNVLADRKNKRVFQCEHIEIDGEKNTWIKRCALTYKAVYDVCYITQQGGISCR